MKKVIIDGVEYRAVTPEVKEEKRSTLWVIRNPDCKAYTACRTREALEKLNLYEGYNPMFKVLVPNENEIIVSEDDVRKAYNQYYYEFPIANFKRFLDLLGFKKDGV